MCVYPYFYGTGIAAKKLERFAYQQSCHTFYIPNKNVIMIKIIYLKSQYLYYTSYYIIINIIIIYYLLLFIDFFICFSV